MDIFSRFPFYDYQPTRRRPSWFDSRPSYYQPESYDQYDSTPSSYFDPFWSSFNGYPSIYRKPARTNSKPTTRKNRSGRVETKLQDEVHEPTVLPQNNPSSEALSDRHNSEDEETRCVKMDCETRNDEDCINDKVPEIEQKEQTVSEMHSDEQIEADELQNDQQQKEQEEDPQKPKPEEIERRLAAIKEIDEKVEALQNRVESFVGSQGCKEYLYISETLMTHLLKLDEIQAEGIDEIRTLRKSVVLKIERYLEQLETAATES